MSTSKSYYSYYDRYCDKDIPARTKQHRLKTEKQKILANKSTRKQITSKFSESITNNAVHISNLEHHIEDASFHEANLLEVPESDSEKINDNGGAQEFDECLRKPICDCSSTNVGEVLLMCLNLAKKHSLTWVALLDMFQVFNSTFNKDILPVTNYMLRKLLNVNTDCLTYHMMCSKCNKYLGKNSTVKSLTCDCGVKVNASSVGSFFIEVNIKQQLTKLFSDENIVESLSHRFHRTKIKEHGLEDIFDGNVYKEYANNEDLLGNEFNLSYTINTDGCQASDCSKISVWPIYIMLHELPENIRRKHILLAGLWVSKTEPDMNIHMQPLVDQANELSSKGFKWFFQGKEIISKLYPLGCCVDSVARCALLCMKKFNGLHGCTYCEHPTEAVSGVRKYPMQESVPIKRTDESIKRKMLVAHELDEGDITGVWGPAAIMNLKHFNLANGMILDFMHSCLLGVTELYTKIILTSSKKDYYVGSPEKLHLIDKRLLSIRPPTCIAKVSRSIKERNMWKASEWLSWLLFYSMICLHGILKKKYLDNLGMFVGAMNILLQESISPSMLENARVLLIKFVVNFEILYGKEFMHYNVHLLLHLTDTVKNWGPLHSANTFPFENENKLLLKMKHCNYRIAQQIVYRLLIYQQVPLLHNTDIISNRIKKVCDSLPKKRVKNFCQVNDCILIGQGKICTLSMEEINCLEKLVNVAEIQECKKYMKMIYNGCRYTTCGYKRSIRTNDSVMQTKKRQFGIISKIYKIKCNNVDNIFIIFHPINIIEQNLTVNDLTHYHRIANINQMIVVKVIEYTMLFRPSIIMHLKSGSYVASIAKGALGKYIN